MNEASKALGNTVSVFAAGIYVVLALFYMLALIALPFVALGVGLGITAWVTCLLAPFC